MSDFELTKEAFRDMEANVFRTYGTHTERRDRIGGSGRVVGEVDFDPARHKASDIYPLSHMSFVTGQPRVRRVMRNRPLHINLVGDTTPRAEDSKVTAAKRRVTTQLIKGIDEAVPGVTDKSYICMVGEDIGEVNDDTRIKTDDRNQLMRELSGLAMHRMAIAISDFQGVELMPGSLDKVIAIKLNHPLEREIPANVGRISLGGAHELDTRNPQQLIAYNGLLQRRHETTVSGLEAAGATVTSVVFDPSFESGYDISGADERLAAAVKRVEGQPQA